MQNKKNVDIWVGNIIQGSKSNKYQIIQKINQQSLKKKKPQLIINNFSHISTFIIKQCLNNEYKILKRYQVNIKTPSKQQSPQKQLRLIDQLKDNILYHPNLLTIEDVFYAQNVINIIEQYCEEGDLYYYVRRQAKKSVKVNKVLSFHQKLIAKWLLQVLLAMEHLHHHQQAHLLIKLENLYLTPLANIKLNESYLLNCINFKKNIKRQKTSNSIIDGYEPMLARKKFQLQQKKDIFDFGQIIADLCNSSSKKDIKIKSSNHLHPFYSQELDQIYLDCLNVKKTNLTVKDLLRTSYFLQIMRQFIIDKKLNFSVFQRIPIKQYSIHKKSKKIVQIKQKQTQTDKKQNHTDLNKNIFPKIDKKHDNIFKIPLTPQMRKNRDQRRSQSSSKRNIKMSIQKLKNKQVMEQRQKLSRQKRNNSRNEIRSSIQRQKKNLQKYKKTSQKQRKTSQKEKKTLQTPPIKKSLLPPPYLPPSKSKQKVEYAGQKQLKQKIVIKSKQKTQQTQQKNVYPQITLPLIAQITFGKPSIKSYSQQKIQPSIQQSNLQNFNSNQISQHLAKIFSDLQIRQEDDQEISFQMTEQEEQDFRLTYQNQLSQTLNQNNDVMIKTYKNKFEQIVSELQAKYQPNLSTIIQKTMEYDSNDFVINQQLLRKFKLEQGIPQMPSQFGHQNQHIQQQI